jgi:hypothetical protein
MVISASSHVKIDLYVPESGLFSAENILRELLNPETPLFYSSKSKHA